MNRRGFLSRWCREHVDNHHVFILGVIMPWKRYNPAWNAMEWSCGFGYWTVRWGRQGL